ncbi:AAA family ATPase [Nitrobacter sp. NHB1]|uniref:AAA family ATPase n=1 Tax=Nitrobacter sp. NHB1 TaxID=3119830 RepID=UPI002FFF34F5
MRIERLILERYGIFADHTLLFHPRAALHVVYGANEAGKTSALSAIGDLLFGFGGRTPYDFRHDSKTLRVGGAFRHSNGELIAARRRKGNKNTLIDAADQPLPDDWLTSLLGGVSREIYSREFGLTAQALRDGGNELLNAGGRLAETLAASSVGMTTLSRIREKLQLEADGLFTPRRSSGKPFYLALDRRDNADRRLRDAIVTREALQQSESAARDANEHLEALTAEHKVSGSTLARWQRTLRVYPKLARLEQLAAELAAFADLPAVPSQSLVEWRQSLDAEAAFDREMSTLDMADAADRAEIAALAVNETLLSERDAIDALRERLGAIRKAIEDLPRRRQARDAARDALDDAARRLGLASHEALLERLPTDLALAHVRDLLDRAGRLQQAITDADMRHARAQQELQDIAAGESEAHAVIDPEQLRQRLDALGDIPAQADRLRHDTASLDIESGALVAEAASLDPLPGALETLRSLPLPDGASIANHARAAERNESEEKWLRDALNAADNAIAASESELARLASSGSGPTRVDLAGARQERDIHLDGLRAVLDGDQASRFARLSDVMRSSQIIDSMTDLLLADTGRAARQEDAQQRIAAGRAERERIVTRLANLRTQITAAAAAWTQQWAPSGLTPRSPAVMQRWRERLDGILNRLDKRDAQKAGIDALAATLDANKAAVIAFLEGAGRSPDRTLPPNILFREAKARFDELQRAWTEARARSASKMRIERDVREATAARDAAQSGLSDLLQVWPMAMTGIGLTGEATTPQAEAALTVWNSVVVPKASHEREGRSVKTMEADIRTFDRDVFDIARSVAPHLGSEDAQETLARLLAALAETRSAGEARKRLFEACAKRAAARKGLEAQRASATMVLDEARRILAVADSAALHDTIDRLSARGQLENERARLLRDLHEASDGRDEAALRREQEGLDLDQLPGDIALETIRQEQLLKDITSASALSHQKQGELDALLKGRDASGTAAERAEANAELLSVAERWLLRAAASRLAARTIERHRAMVQDPLISRAGTLFAMATGDAFTGLGVAYGDDDQPILVAQRNSNNGEHVQITGLSEGTRDQLFLALRLALLERRTSEPMPFIGDDLLTSFDDERTLAGLRLLAAAGKHQQIILFTHHRHVVNLARTVQDHAVDFIDL